MCPKEKLELYKNNINNQLTVAVLWTQDWRFELNFW